MTVAGTVESAPAEPRTLSQPVSTADRVFRTVTVAAAMASLVVMGLIAIFLMVQAWPAVHKAGFGFFTVSADSEA